MGERLTESDRMLTEVYVVQWSSEPMPKEQWSGDRFWPFVEVHTDYGQAIRRYGALRDEGMPASFKVTRVFPPDQSTSGGAQ